MLHRLDSRVGLVSKRSDFSIELKQLFKLFALHMQVGIGCVLYVPCLVALFQQVGENSVLLMKCDQVLAEIGVEVIVVDVLRQCSDRCLFNPDQLVHFFGHDVDLLHHIVQLLLLLFYEFLLLALVLNRPTQQPELLFKIVDFLLDPLSIVFCLVEVGVLIDVI